MIIVFAPRRKESSPDQRERELTTTKRSEEQRHAHHSKTGRKKKAFQTGRVRRPSTNLMYLPRIWHMYLPRKRTMNRRRAHLIMPRASPANAIHVSCVAVENRRTDRRYGARLLIASKEARWERLARRTQDNPTGSHPIPSYPSPNAPRIPPCSHGSPTQPRTPYPRNQAQRTGRLTPADRAWGHSGRGHRSSKTSSHGEV